MATTQALSMPTEESYCRLEAIRQAQAGAQQQQQREQHVPSRSGPVMPM
jgi:hypothetical protein